MAPSMKLQRVAVRLSTHYLNKLKSRNPNHQPWDPSVPVTETKVFPHFIKAAAVVREVEAAPKDWVAAQFDWFTRFGKYRFPFPTQLHNDGARLRYIEYIEKKAETESCTAKPEHQSNKDPLKFDLLKARSLARRFHSTVPEVLRLMPREFTRAFHENQGTWSFVSEQYED